MKDLVLCGCCLVLLAEAPACTLGWKHRAGALTLPDSHSQLLRGVEGPPGADAAAPPAAAKAAPPRRISLALPDGWHWFMRGDDLVATRDGVFLQNIFVERIRVDQVEEPVLGTFWLAAFSSKQWPVRTVESLKKRFAPGMSGADAAEVFLDSRRNDPAVGDLEIREVATREIAGNPAFRAVFDFRLKDPGPRKSFGDVRFRDPRRMPRYRSVYCGFVIGEWFYGFGYTAALRHYFDKDAGAFESVLQSVAVAPP